MLKTVRGCHHPRESCVGRYSLDSSAVIEASPRDMYANHRPGLQKFGLSEASLAEVAVYGVQKLCTNTSEVFASAVGGTGFAGHYEEFSKMVEEEEEKKIPLLNQWMFSRDLAVWDQISHFIIAGPWASN